MKEYIEREAVVEMIEKNSTTRFDWSEAVDIEDLIPAIKDIPAADVAPVRHGEWLPDPNISSIYICSCCQNESHLCQPNYEEIVAWQFCPKCGAIMDGGKSHE